MTSWRLLIALCGFVGYVDVAIRQGDPLRALEDLSNLASFAAGCAYLGLALYPFLGVRGAERGVGRDGPGRRVPGAGWPRGALAVALLLVGTVWHTLMDGFSTGYLTLSSLFTHLVTPLLVLIDWVAADHRRLNRRWWYPLSWTLPLLGYLVFMLAAGVDSYSGFLDPEADGFAVTLGLFVVAVVVAGYGLLGVARLRARWGTGDTAAGAGAEQVERPEAAEGVPG